MLDEHSCSHDEAAWLLSSDVTHVSAFEGTVQVQHFLLPFLFGLALLALRLQRCFLLPSDLPLLLRRFLVLRVVVFRLVERVRDAAESAFFLGLDLRMSKAIEVSD